MKAETLVTLIIPTAVNLDELNEKLNLEILENNQLLKTVISELLEKRRKLEKQH